MMSDYLKLWFIRFTSRFEYQVAHYNALLLRRPSKAFDKKIHPNIFYIYSDLPNNPAANLILFWKFFFQNIFFIYINEKKVLQKLIFR